MQPRSICAWCDAVLAEGTDDSPDVSHGLCASCAAEQGFVDVVDLREFAQRDLDRLPFGVLELDPVGIVSSYNRAEENLSGLEREDVIGRNFFHEIAPCSNVAEFAGVYRAIVRDGSKEPVRISFVFRFPSREVLVDISLSYDARRRSGLLLVRAAQ